MNAERLTITEAKINQVTAITEMWSAIDNCANDQPFGGKLKNSQQRATEIITHAIDSPTASVLVAMDEKYLTGTITGHLYQRPGVKLSSVGVIYSLWVEPKFRHHGIGQELLSSIERHLQLMGAQAFQVGWDTSNHLAAEWWMRRGYQAYETIASKKIS